MSGERNQLAPKPERKTAKVHFASYDTSRADAPFPMFLSKWLRTIEIFRI